MTKAHGSKRRAAKSAPLAAKSARLAHPGHKEVRGEILRVRLTSPEMVELLDMAKAEDLQPSQFVRRMIDVHKRYRAEAARIAASARTELAIRIANAEREAAPLPKTVAERDLMGPMAGRAA